MDVVKNNNFSKDIFGVRIERLIAIEGNIASIQDELQAPAHIINWSSNCCSIFTNILATSDIDRNEISGAYSIADLKEKQMRKEYQNCRMLAKSIFREKPVYYNDYGFNEPFPLNANDKLSRVNLVLSVNQRHIAEAVTPLLPVLLTQRLENAKNEYDAALQNINLEKSEAEHSKAALQQLFNSDTALLQELKSWWYIRLGKDDPRITLIGMVNPKKPGAKRKHKVSAPQTEKKEIE